MYANVVKIGDPQAVTHLVPFCHFWIFAWVQNLNGKGKERRVSWTWLVSSGTGTVMRKVSILDEA